MFTGGLDGDQQVRRFQESKDRFPIRGLKAPNVIAWGEAPRA